MCWQSAIRSELWFWTQGILSTWVLTSMRPVLKGITTVHVLGVLHASVVDGSEIALHIKQWGGQFGESVY